MLRISECRHGAQARIRYRALLTAAFRRIASDPAGALTRDRSDVFEGVRRYHIRHSRSESREAIVSRPVHVIFYRVAVTGSIEIVRVLHERMEPTEHLGT